MSGPQIHPTALVDPSAVLHETVTVGPYSIIGPNVTLGAHCEVRERVTIEGPSTFGEKNVFFTGAVIGSRPQDLKYKGEPTTLVVGSNNLFREYCTVNRGTTGGGGETSIGNNCLMMAYAHVAHDCHVGNFVILANSATLAGHVTIQDRASIGGLTPIHQFTTIGRYAFVGGLSRISQDVVPFTRVAGSPSRAAGINSVGLRRAGFTPEALKALKEVSKLLFFSNLNTTQAVEEITASVNPLPEVLEVIEFIKKSERGITK